MTLSHLEKKLLDRKTNELMTAISNALEESAKIITNAVNGYPQITCNDAKEINEWLANAISLRWVDGRYIVEPSWVGPMPPVLQRGLLRVASDELLAKIDSISELQGE